MRRTAIVLMFALALLPWAQQQAQAQRNRVSPHEQVSLTFDDGKKVTIDYGRPKRQDPKTGEARKIFGGLVPYDRPWRAGADEATTLTTTADLAIGGTTVPAGTYTLYVIPKQSGNWTLIVSKATGQWGIPYPGQDQDFARIDAVTVKKISTPVDQFTISLEKAGPKAATLKMSWENMEASIPVQEK